MSPIYPYQVPDCAQGGSISADHVQYPRDQLPYVGRRDADMLEKALTIVVGESGVIKVTVHRDPAKDHSAEPGVELLRRLLPSILEMDRIALEPLKT